jgi:hypothetical protein
MEGTMKCYECLKRIWPWQDRSRLDLIPVETRWYHTACWAEYHQRKTRAIRRAQDPVPFLNTAQRAEGGHEV